MTPNISKVTNHKYYAFPKATSIPKAFDLFRQFSSSSNFSNFFLGREIFQSPVSLSCPHTYCQSCLIGLKKPGTSTSSSSTESTPTSSFRSGSFSHSSHIHQPNQCFICAICRKESLGYVRYRELENQLDTLETSCSNCAIVFTLSELRKHSETCLPMRKNQTNEITEAKPSPLIKHLSDSQAKALEKAQQGENRSTFQCPFCPRAK
jgi:hypothetical protein